MDATNSLISIESWRVLSFSTYCFCQYDGARREDPDADFPKSKGLFQNGHKAKTENAAEPDIKNT